MTEQILHAGYVAQMMHSMKYRLSRELKRYKRTYTILEYYSRGLKLHLLALVIFSMLLGLMETFQIVLLYPILNASFDLTEAGLPFFEPMYDLVRTYINLPEVIAFCLLFIGFVILTFFATIIYKITSLQFTKAVIVKTKGSIFDKLKENDYRYFVENKQGDVLYNVVSAPGKIRIFLDYATRIFSDMVVALTVLVTLFFMSPVAMGILLAGGIGFIIVVRFVGNRVSYLIGKVQMQSISSENAVISQYIQGLRQIRSVHADSYWQKQYTKALRTYWDKYTRYRFTETLPAVLLQMLFFIGIAGVVIALFYIHADRFIYVLPLIGTFAFSALKILPRLSNIGQHNMQMMDAYPDLERIHAFLNDRRYNTIQNGTVPFEELTSDIVYEDVGFRYYKAQDLIENLNLTIHKNKVTALVGHSGSGKSTIISLLLRYYDVTSGRILLNGIDLREFDIATFLEKIGYVSQDTFIYNASVRENIAFGGDYTNEQIIAAAERANIHAFITSLRDDYDSIVGDQGLKLSGGEKQRIAIARALIREPEILVLDEATSNLDNESEAIVQESINQISKTVTTFIVAHRLSTIRRADIIYVMSKGRVVESGSHENLMEKQGRYYELYKRSG
ncbi:ABC transporter ATP-binding protein [Methanocalculus taiwanensis]|uniref:ABC transporter ATP-binding protein n=1 Tax=Methanocalculus taiwanensis TaxID=106207 RepID=A0ABD4THL4_9EURY|nr:ABC transporter ATP-binding protein [Methanocalculus taiwanensis]MCQ1538186.1 ABC transporter ATP-binding protein [Methanocalculus taiwanensis]